MSDQALSPGADAAVRMRKERVHSAMLIELLALLIFVAFAFAFVLKEEGDKINPWKEKYDRVEMELKTAKKEIADLEKRNRTLARQVASLEASVRRLIASHDGPLAANDKVVPLDRSEFDRLANDAALAQTLQAENANLRVRLNGGGTDRPNCLVTPGFLISVELLSDGNFRVRPAWSQNAGAAVAAVDGATQLGGSGVISPAQFSALSSRVDGWARQQSPACGFRARVSESHGNLTLYKRQVRTVERYFYTRRD